MTSKLWRLGSLYLVLVVVGLLMACASPAKEVVSFPIEVTDQLGRVVKLEKIPERIISLSPGNTEILFALGLGDRVVGVTDYCNYPSEAEQIEKVGGYSTPDIEKVLSLSPDLVLAGSIHEKEFIPKLERRGLTVLALARKNLGEVLETITLVSQVTGRDEAGAQLVEQLMKRIERITQITVGLSQRPRVFYITWHDPLWTSGSGTITDDLIQKTGGENIAADLVGWKTIGLETIIIRNPEVIIACTGHGGAKDLPFEWAKTEPRLKDIDARKHNRVYLIDADLVSRGAPRTVDALEKFAEFIHPELFKKD